jgi:hypothetical protein
LHRAVMQAGSDYRWYDRYIALGEAGQAFVSQII